MHRTSALLKSIASAVHYRYVGNSALHSYVTVRSSSVAASAGPQTPGISIEDTADTHKQQDVEDVDVSASPQREFRPVRFATLQFLLQRRMPVNSMRLLMHGIRAACDERRAEDVVPYLGPWIAQLTRPDMLERIAPWQITDVLRDLRRLTRTLGTQPVRNALPPKHLQTLANRLVVQGFDKLTPLQLARATETFAQLRPYQRRSTFDPTAMDPEDASSEAVSPAWPSSDWVDELVDWLHNLKPNAEPWPRTSSYCLSIILYGLARSNYKPRQPTFQAAASTMKAKLEEQLTSRYVSRSALTNSAIAWNIWRVNPDEYAAGFWDVYFKNATQVMEEYVDTAPDPPSFEDDIGDDVGKTSEEQLGENRRRQRFGPSLFTKRREFRRLLVTQALAIKNFNLSKQFNDSAKAIWLQRIDEQAPFVLSMDAKRILDSLDGMGVTLKTQTKDKLVAAVDYRKRQSGPRQDLDVDDFDDTPSPQRVSSAPGSRQTTGPRGAARSNAFDDYFDDDFKGGSSRGTPPASGRASGRSRGEDDFAFDDKPF